MFRNPEDVIESCALKLRRRLGIDNVLATCMYSVLKKISTVAPSFRFQTALESTMGADEALVDDSAHMLYVRESVIEDAKAGRVRARFTLAHEIGHYFLGHKGVNRRNPDKAVYVGSTERVQENEADIFAGYLLVPTELALDAGGAEEIAEKFQVSSRVAEIAYERIQRARRRLNGEKRRSPDSVLNFLKEAQRRGYDVKSDISTDKH